MSNYSSSYLMKKMNLGNEDVKIKNNFNKYLVSFQSNEEK